MKRARSSSYVSNTSRPYQGARRPRSKAVARAPPPSRSSVKKMIMSMIDTKNFDYEQNTTVPLSGSGLIHLSGISQGTAFNQRVGAQVDAIGLQISYLMTLADTTNVMRLVVFRVTGTQVPTAPEVIAFASGGLGHIGNISFHNQKRLFRVLHDSGPICLNSDTPQYACNVQIRKAMPMEFVSALTTDEKGGIYAIAYSDSLAAAHPILQLNTTVYYKDA